MINRFSPSTISALQSYVYVYYDPDDHEVFYVGKGNGNRVFAHLSEQSESEKVQRIREIQSRGKQPGIDILVHGIDDTTALKVEAAVIDLLGVNNLTNRKRGDDSTEFGRMSVDMAEAQYNPVALKSTDIAHECLFINIAGWSDVGSSRIELYDQTRAAWVVGKDRADQVELVLAVRHGVIIEAYEPTIWLPAGSTLLATRDNDLPEDRFEFVGNIAPESIRQQYVGKSVNYWAHGERNPIHYESPAVV